jgi:hypothetical protein
MPSSTRTCANACSPIGASPASQSAAKRRPAPAAGTTISRPWSGGLALAQQRDGDAGVGDVRDGEAAAHGGGRDAEDAPRRVGRARAEQLERRLRRGEVVERELLHHDELLEPRLERRALPVAPEEEQRVAARGDPHVIDDAPLRRRQDRRDAGAVRDGARVVGRHAVHEFEAVLAAHRDDRAPRLSTDHARLEGGGGLTLRIAEMERDVRRRGVEGGAAAGGFVVELLRSHGGAVEPPKCAFRGGGR